MLSEYRIGIFSEGDKSSSDRAFSSEGHLQILKSDCEYTQAGLVSSFLPLRGLDTFGTISAILY